jgi:hypothetical protein
MKPNRNRVVSYDVLSPYFKRVLMLICYEIIVARDTFYFIYFLTLNFKLTDYLLFTGGHCGRNCMVVGFITTFWNYSNPNETPRAYLFLERIIIFKKKTNDNLLKFSLQKNNKDPLKK